MKRFLFSIALLFTALAGCSNHEGESTAPKSELNVMSYNIRYANASDKGDAASLPVTRSTIIDERMPLIM